MSYTVERVAIDPSRLPEQIRKHVSPEAPAPLKMMAARGMLPVAPEQNLALLYNLHGDSDGEVRQAVTQSIADLPSNILLPVIGQMAHPGVLDWIADCRKEPSILEVIITNTATHDHTVARLARRVDTKLCDIIATNQVRLLQAPFIIEELYLNANARMATVDRLVDLAKRNGVRLDGVPALAEAMESGQDIFNTQSDDPEVQQLLQKEATAAAAEASMDEDWEHDREDDEDEKKNQAKKSLHHKIGEMSTSEKIRFATVGSRAGLELLIRDPNRLVHMAAVRSPQVKPADIRKWAKDKSVPDNVITYICNQRDWTRHYDVKLALCMNPKTSLREALSLLAYLRTNDLKNLASNRDVPMQVSRQAKSLHQKRSGGSRKK